MRHILWTLQSYVGDGNVACAKYHIGPSHIRDIRNTWFLGRTWVCLPNSISIGLAVLQELTVQPNTQSKRRTYIHTDRQTDIQTDTRAKCDMCLAINRISAMQAFGLINSYRIGPRHCTSSSSCCRQHCKGGAVLQDEGVSWLSEIMRDAICN